MFLHILVGLLGFPFCESPVHNCYPFSWRVSCRFLIDLSEGIAEYRLGFPKPGHCWHLELGFFVVEDCPVQGRVSHNIPGLYPLGSSRLSSLSRDKPKHLPILPIIPSWEPLM